MKLLRTASMLTVVSFLLMSCDMGLIQVATGTPTPAASPTPYSSPTPMPSTLPSYSPSPSPPYSPLPELSPTPTPTTYTSPTPVPTPSIEPIPSPSPTPWADMLAAIPYRDMVTVTEALYTQSSRIDGVVQSFNHVASTFLMGKYEITYALWYHVYQWAIANGYHFQNPGREGSAGVDGAPPSAACYEPVVKISWADAIVWCNAYSELSGYVPVYTYAGATLRDSRNEVPCSDAACTWFENGYRLPTEAEWHFAASNRGATNFDHAAGSAKPYHVWADVDPANGIDDGKEAFDPVAVYGMFYDQITPMIPTGVTKTATVGSKAANPLGIFDLSGNAMEWCWDSDDDALQYPTEPLADYRGDNLSSMKIRRGGGWQSVSTDISIGKRESVLYSATWESSGFRVARYTY